MSTRMKELWADPERRAAILAKQAEGQAKWRGIGRREGIPDGMRKEDAEPLNEQARESAKQTMAELEKAGALVDDSAAAKEALEAAITVMREPGNKATKLQAAKLVLEYTKAKPAQKVHATVDTAEAWLKAVTDANDIKLIEGEVIKDA